MASLKIYKTRATKLKETEMIQKHRVLTLISNVSCDRLDQSALVTYAWTSYHKGRCIV